MPRYTVPSGRTAYSLNTVWSGSVLRVSDSSFLPVFLSITSSPVFGSVLNPRTSTSMRSTSGGSMTYSGSVTLFNSEGIVPGAGKATGVRE